MKNDRKFNPALFARLSDGDGLALNRSCSFAWRQNATPGRRVTCSSRVITDANQQIADFAQKGIFSFRPHRFVEA